MRGSRGGWRWKRRVRYRPARWSGEEAQTRRNALDGFFESFFIRGRYKFWMESLKHRRRDKASLDLAKAPVGQGNRSRENLREDIRKWVEECDYLRGFHVFVDDHSGFGGLCEKVPKRWEMRTVKAFHSHVLLPQTAQRRKGNHEKSNKQRGATTMNF